MIFKRENKAKNRHKSRYMLAANSTYSRHLWINIKFTLSNIQVRVEYYLRNHSKVQLPNFKIMIKKQ